MAVTIAGNFSLFEWASLKWDSDLPELSLVLFKMEANQATQLDRWDRKEEPYRPTQPALYIDRGAPVVRRNSDYSSLPYNIPSNKDTFS